MNYAALKKFDIANGPGVRVSLFVSGCRHRCKNCFNKEAWDFSYGKPFTESTEREILNAMSAEYITGLSLLGSEPFEPENRLKNYFEERLTNASAESFNAKIKAFRSQLRGVADLKFFMFRLARLYA